MDYPFFNGRFTSKVLNLKGFHSKMLVNWWGFHHSWWFFHSSHVSFRHFWDQGIRNHFEPHHVGCWGELPKWNGFRIVTCDRMFLEASLPLMSHQTLESYVMIFVVLVSFVHSGSEQERLKPCIKVQIMYIYIYTYHIISYHICITYTVNLIHIHIYKLKSVSDSLIRSTQWHWKNTSNASHGAKAFICWKPPVAVGTLTFLGYLSERNGVSSSF